MLGCMLLLRYVLPLLAGAATIASAQAPSGLVRTEGVDEASGVAYVLLSLDGHALASATPETPVLTAQCTQRNGKPRFEVFVSLGAVASAETHRFHGDWRPTPEYPSQPPVRRTTLTLEFLGYVKQKPLKSDWERMREPEGEFRFLPPGLHSGNLGDFTTDLYLRYLMALPTLRVSLAGEPAVEFDATPWLDQVRREPACKGSGL